MGARRTTLSRPKRVLILCCIAVGAASLAAVMRFHFVQTQTAITSLRTEMSSYVSPFVVPSTDLQALRAERYAMETRFDPLFALAGSDPAGIEKALIPLRGEAAVILGTYTPEERAQIEPVLYPHTYLALLPELETLRRTVVRSPSPDVVRRYDAQLKKTIRAYRDDMSAYNNTLSGLATSSRNTTLHYLAGSTTITQIIDKLQKIDEKVAGIDDMREQRYRCFTGELSACTPLSESFEKLASPSSSVKAATPPTTLSRSLAHRDIVDRAFFEMLGTQETRGVVVKLSSSACLSGNAPAYYYFFQSKEEQDIYSNTATPLNDVYFYDLEKSMRSQNNPPAYLKELSASGLRYNFQNIGNLYFCPNSGNVLAITTTLVALHDKLKAQPLFETDSAYPEITRLEKLITRSAVPSDADMDAYIRAIQTALQTDGEKQLELYLGNGDLLRAEEYIHEWNNRSANFEQLLTAAHHINRLSKGIIAVSKAMPYSFLTSRVYASVFFMPFNESVSGETMLLLDAINERPPLSNFYLASYRNDLNSVFDNRSVLDELRTEQKIIDDVLNVER